MKNLELESTVTLRQAYLIMFEYLEKYWEKRSKPDEIGALLGDLSLWNTIEGKRPMNGSVFPNWLNCARTVLTDEQRDGGYTQANIDLT